MMRRRRDTGLVPALAALVGNVVVTIVKWIGFFASGSAVLFSEAVHSMADTANQSLLLVGIVRARRKPSQAHAYGYGRERFFWALISACGIFFAGAGITVLHGVEAFLHPEPYTFTAIAVASLAVSFVVESVTFVLALRALASRMPRAPWRERLTEGDPVTLAVVYEDGAAVLGVAIALASIWLSSITGDARLDGAGSALIGVLLGGLAVLLIRMNREYLLGRAMSPDTEAEIVELLEHDPVIEKVIDFKSSALGLDEYRVKCEVEVNGSAIFREMREREFISGRYEDIEGPDDFLRFCVEYADRIPRLIGEHINRLEKAVHRAHPTVTHIDIELN
jgi:zinc transporter 9